MKRLFFAAIAAVTLSLSVVPMAHAADEHQWEQNTSQGNGQG